MRLILHDAYDFLRGINGNIDHPACCITDRLQNVLSLRPDCLPDLRNNVLIDRPAGCVRTFLDRCIGALRKLLCRICKIIRIILLFGLRIFVRRLFLRGLITQIPGFLIQVIRVLAQIFRFLLRLSVHRRCLLCLIILVKLVDACCRSRHNCRPK